MKRNRAIEAAIKRWDDEPPPPPLSQAQQDLIAEAFRGALTRPPGKRVPRESPEI
jgi:hypothetical protein